MKHRTAELSDALLDAAVAQALGYPLDSDGDRLDVRQSGGAPTPWHPSTDWRDGGPIIEREHICLDPEDAELWSASKDSSGPVWSYGPTPLIAAMRAYVASKLGAEIELGEQAART